MELAAALARIGHHGPVAPDLATLRAVQRAWLATVPYENLDIQLRRAISLDPAVLVDKLITRRRGGYCYEMNGTFGLLLEAIGFSVTRVKAGVEREIRGDSAWGNHLALLVDLDGERWLADVGLGDGPLEPLPLRPGSYSIGPLGYQVEQLEDQIWRVRDHPDCSVPSFDLDTTPREIAEFAGHNEWQSTSPDSGFVRSLALLRPYADHAVALRARILTRYGPAVPGGKQRTTLSTVDEWAAALVDEFGVPVAELSLGALWERASAQHEEWLAGKAGRRAARASGSAP